MSRRALGLTVLLIVAATAVDAQDSRALAPRESYTVPAESDTVFVLSRDIFVDLLIRAESLALADSSIIVLEKKAALLGEIITEQQGIIDVRTEAYAHYRDLWTTTDRDLEEAEVKVDRYKRDRWRWAVISALVLGVTGFAIGSAVN